MGWRRRRRRATGPCGVDAEHLLRPTRDDVTASVHYVHFTLDDADVVAVAEAPWPASQHTRTAGTGLDGSKSPPPGRFPAAAVRKSWAEVHSCGLQHPAHGGQCRDAGSNRETARREYLHPGS